MKASTKLFLTSAGAFLLSLPPLSAPLWWEAYSEAPGQGTEPTMATIAMLLGAPLLIASAVTMAKAIQTKQIEHIDASAHSSWYDMLSVCTIMTTTDRLGFGDLSHEQHATLNYAIQPPAMYGRAASEQSRQALDHTLQALDRLHDTNPTMADVRTVFDALVHILEWETSQGTIPAAWDQLNPRTAHTALIQTREEANASQHTPRFENTRSQA